MLTLTITDEQLQKGFQDHLDKLMGDTYNNPVKKIIEDMFNSYKSVKSPEMIELEAQLQNMIKEHMKTPTFALALGTAMAAEMAKKQMEKLK